MAKRILALVMVLVLSLSVLSIEAFAANNDYTNMNNIKVTHTGTTLTVTWNAVNNATKYDVVVRNSSGATVGSSLNVTGTSANVNVSSYGDFSVNVTAYNSTSALIGGGSVSYTIPYSSTNSGITVSSNGASSVTVSWTSKSYINNYYVSYSYYNDKNANTTGTATAANTGTTCSTTLPVAYDKLISVTVREGDANGTVVGTWRPGSTGSGSSSSTGTVSLNTYTGILSWALLGTGQSYSIYVNGQYVGSTKINENTYSVASIINANYYTTLVFTVIASNGTTIGTATYTPGSYNGGNNGSYYNNFKVTIEGNNAVVSWNAAPSAYTYVVTYTQGSTNRQAEMSSSQTSISLIYTSGLTVLVQYKTSANSNLYTIGSATVTANGSVSYGTYGGSTGGSSSNNGIGHVINNGCSLNVGANSTTVTWNAVTGATRYLVLYTDKNGKINQAPSSYTTSAVIPVGYSNCGTGFEVNVYPVGSNGLSVNSVVLSASYVVSNNGAGNNSGSTGSTTKNLKLTEKNSNTTTVSWDAVNGADYYILSYGAYNGYTSVDIPTVATSCDIPFGKGSSYQVIVVAHTAGGLKSVGQAYHKGGDPYPSTSSSNDNKNEGSNNTTTDTTPIYVTGFKGTTGDKKVTLSWNAAKGATSYTVYWKRSNASSWNKAGSTSKRAVNITGLNNGVAYDFKVVANDRDSGILTSLSPSASGTSTKVAPDPAGAGTTSTVPVITYINGGNGTITLEWEAAKNAKAYQIWIAKSDSSSYAQSTDTYYYPNAKTSINGTTATITGLPSGTYKVRVKASTDGKTWPKLSDASCIKSDYKAVTVK